MAACSASALEAHGGGAALVVARALLRRANTMPTMASTPSTHTVPSAAPSAHVMPHTAAAAAAGAVLEGACVDSEGGATKKGDGVGDDWRGADVCATTTATGRDDGDCDVVGCSVVGSGVGASVLLVGRGDGELDLRDGVTGTGASVDAVGYAEGCSVGASKTAHVGVHKPAPATALACARAPASSALRGGAPHCELTSGLKAMYVRVVAHHEPLPPPEPPPNGSDSENGMHALNRANSPEPASWVEKGKTHCEPMGARPPAVRQAPGVGCDVGGGKVGALVLACFLVGCGVG